MLIKRAYKFRFYPTPEQADLLARTFGCARFIYNWGLNFRQDAYKTGKPSNNNACSAALTLLKKDADRSWLNEVSSVALQQSLIHLNKAYEKFFAKEAGFPKFKKKANRQSFTLTKNAFTYQDGKLTLAKMKDPLDVRWSREFKGMPSSITVSKDPDGRYFVSLLVEEDIKPLKKTDKVVGIDMGLTRFLTTSNGEVVTPPKYLAMMLERLRRLSRQLSRKQKGSKNRDKARLRLARLHARIHNLRQDFLNKLSIKLIRENQVLAIESLSVSNMLKNHHLARAISDAAWAEFFRQLKYKAEWYGRTVWEAPRFFPSSKLCSTPGCGYIYKALSLKEREWTCPECGVVHDREQCAADNVKQAYLYAANTAGSPEFTPVELCPAV